jgi:hypothetical protein
MYTFLDFVVNYRADVNTFALVFVFDVNIYFFF